MEQAAQWKWYKQMMCTFSTVFPASTTLTWSTNWNIKSDSLPPTKLFCFKSGHQQPFTYCRSPGTLLGGWRSEVRYGMPWIHGPAAYDWRSCTACPSVSVHTTWSPKTRDYPFSQHKKQRKHQNTTALQQPLVLVTKGSVALSDISALTCNYSSVLLSLLYGCIDNHPHL